MWKFVVLLIALTLATVNAQQPSASATAENPYYAQRLTFYNESGQAVTALGTVSGASVTADTVVSAWFEITGFDSVQFNLWTLPGDTGTFKVGWQYGYPSFPNDSTQKYLNGSVKSTLVLDSIVSSIPNGKRGYIAGAVASIGSARGAGGVPQGAMYARVIIGAYPAADAAHSLALQGTAGGDATKLNNNRLYRRRVNK